LTSRRTTTLTEPNIYSIESICLNMRESDAVEVFNVMPVAGRMHLAQHTFSAMSNQGRGRVAWYQGRPAALIALTQMRPGVWEIWMFGTDAFRNVAIDCVRWARREARDILDHAEGHRIQCDCRVGHPDAHRLIRAFGAHAEGPPMTGYGSDGSDYQRYVWLREKQWHVLEPHLKRSDV
jgi:hypothetical protein